MMLKTMLTRASGVVKLLNPLTAMQTADRHTQVVVELIEIHNL